ncbi:hypothetical protein BZA70DRAFT_273813 [Myxozyma melibiosi]|uniref:Large ribosomal subunit protein bL32m n=1 Tax=Myxozyma melibiosi TaxID=54550 RepID=A0ABR1FFX9_9ASCO
MASRHIFAPSWAYRLSAAIMPRLALPLPSLSAPLTPPITIRIPLPTLPSPSDFGFGSPFGGIVFAVPKSKTSLRKRRMRRLIPGDKKVKPVESLTACPGCGRVKRMHTVCTPCHDDIREVWRAESGKTTKGTPEEKPPTPESIDPDFIEMLNKKHTKIPNRKPYLEALSREENSLKRPPTMDYQDFKADRKLPKF